MTSRTRIAALAAVAATALLGSAAPASAVLGSTVAYRFDAGGDALPAVEVTLVAQPIGAEFHCKAVSTVTAASTRAKCFLYQGGTLVASADSGAVPGQTATASGFRLGASVFLNACVEGYTVPSSGGGTRMNDTCADLLVS